MPTAVREQEQGTGNEKQETGNGEQENDFTPSQKNKISNGKSRKYNY